MNGLFKAVVPNHVPAAPPTLHHVTLIKHTWFSSSVETPRLELGVSDKGEMQNMQGYGPPGTWLGTTGLKQDIALDSLDATLIKHLIQLIKSLRLIWNLHGMWVWHPCFNVMPQHLNQI